MKIFTLTRKIKRYLREQGVLFTLRKTKDYLLFLFKTTRYKAKGAYAQIKKDGLKIISYNGNINIYYDNQELNLGISTVTAISVLGICEYSSDADWSVKRINSNTLIIKSRWKRLPLSQIWQIVLSGEGQIAMHMKLELEEDLTIDAQRVSLILSENYNKWKILFNGRVLANSTSKYYLPIVLFHFKGNNLAPVCSITDTVESEILNIELPVEPAHTEYLTGTHGLLTVNISLWGLDQISRKNLLNKEKGPGNLLSLGRSSRDSQAEKESEGFKVLLVNLPWQNNGSWGVRAGSRWPHIKDKAEGNYLPFPFYLAYAAALLNKNGFKVKLIDAIAEEIPENVFSKMIVNIHPDLLVVETSTASLKNDIEFLKNFCKNIPLVLCGPDINIRDPLFLKSNSFIKYVLFGEYEFTLLDLSRHLRDGKGLGDVPGLIYFDDKGDVRENPPRPISEDLDELPWPLREQLPLKKYLDAPCEMPAYTAQMWASRGCVFKCIFCVWPQIMYAGNHYRARDAVKVVDEMEYLVKQMGIKSIYFDDDTFNIGKQRMLRFCHEIKRRNLNVPWAIMARADLMDEEILKRMKETGLYAVKYGVESAVQALLDNSNKAMDLKKADKMIRFTKQLGIKTHLTFTFGLPGETKETIRKTIEYALELDPDSAQFSITTPYPGTEYFRYLDEKGMILSKDWSDYDGNFKSVIQLEDLTAEELENARKEAVERWLEHVRLKRSLKENYRIFRRYLFSRGFYFTAKKTAGYLNKRLIKIPTRLVLKKINVIRNRFLEVFGNKFISYKDRLYKTIKKIIKYAVTGKMYGDYLDMLGIFDGTYAYKGPDFIQIDLTNNCNNDCIGCWCNSPLLLDKKPDEYTKSQTIPYCRAIELINEVYLMGTKEIYLAGGGEPFMHPQIMEIIGHIKQKKLICDINTNFTLLDEDRIKKIIQLDVDSLVVSVWAASAETYVATHPNKNKDTFYSIKERLRLLNRSKNKFPGVHIYNVITNLNFHEIEEMVDFALEVKADSVGFTVLDTIPNRTDILLLNDQQRKEVLRQCERIGKRNDLGQLQILEFEKFIRRVSAQEAAIAEYDKGAVDSMPCYIGWLFTRIMANGNVNACLKAHRIPMGNIYKHNFVDIWNGSLQRDFRKKTLSLKKDDPYFSLIGNDPNAKVGCYKSCDDMSRNLYIHKRIALLTPFEKANLKITAHFKRFQRKVNPDINLKQMKPFQASTLLEIGALDILLIMLPPWATKMPPLGLAYLAEYLKQKGFNPYVYDFNLKLHNCAREENKVFWQVENLNNKSPEDVAKDILLVFRKEFSLFVNELISTNVKVIGFSTSLVNLWISVEIARRIKIKDPGKIIIFGGPGCFWDYKRVEPGIVDAFVIGEGEEALCSILRAVKDGKDLRNIPGVIIAENGSYKNIIPPEPLDINGIAFPKFLEFRLKDYNKGKDYKPLPVLTSRGCVGRCNYCIDCQMWGALRHRLAENVFDEIECHYKRYGIHEFEFNDLICNGNLKELERFCDLVMKSEYKISWVSYAIIRKDMDYSMFVKLKKGGCHTLIYGVESGSDTILKKMNKYYTAEDAQRIIRFTHQAGICTNINIIVGFPGETEAQWSQTIEFLKRNREYIDEITNVSGCVLFSGSQMWQHPQKFGIILEHADTLLYRDNTGLTPEARKERVKKTLSIISDLGIKCSIINNPTERRIRVSRINDELIGSLKA